MFKSSPLAYGCSIGLGSRIQWFAFAQRALLIPRALPPARPRSSSPPPTSVQQPSGPSLCVRVLNGCVQGTHVLASAFMEGEPQQLDKATYS